MILSINILEDVGLSASSLDSLLLSLSELDDVTVGRVLQQVQTC